MIVIQGYPTAIGSERREAQQVMCERYWDWYGVGEASIWPTDDPNVMALVTEELQTLVYGNGWM